MDKKKYWLIGVACLLVLVGVVGTARASGNFLDTVADRAGFYVASFLQNAGLLSDDAVVGSGNLVLKTSVQKADICLMAGTATNTPCSTYLYNDDGSDRIIQEVVVYTDANSFDDTSMYDITTNTSQYATTSYVLDTNTLTANPSDPLRYSTSTFTVVKNRIWANGEYLVFKTSAVTTTDGYVKVLYDKE